MPHLKRLSQWLNGRSTPRETRNLLVLTLTHPKTFTRVIPGNPRAVETWQMPPGEYLMRVGQHPWDGPSGAPWLYFTNDGHGCRPVGNSQGWLALASRTEGCGLHLRPITLTEAFLLAFGAPILPTPHDGCPYERPDGVSAPRPVPVRENPPNPPFVATVSLLGGPCNGWSVKITEEQQKARVATFDLTPYTDDPSRQQVTYEHGGQVGAFEPSRPWTFVPASHRATDQPPTVSLRPDARH